MYFVVNSNPDSNGEVNHDIDQMPVLDTVDMYQNTVMNGRHSPSSPGVVSQDTDSVYHHHRQHDTTPPPPSPRYHQDDDQVFKDDEETRERELAVMSRHYSSPVVMAPTEADHRQSPCGVGGTAFPTLELQQPEPQSPTQQPDEYAHHLDDVSGASDDDEMPQLNEEQQLSEVTEGETQEV